MALKMEQIVELLTKLCRYVEVHQSLIGHRGDSTHNFNLRIFFYILVIHVIQVIYYCEGRRYKFYFKLLEEEMVKLTGVLVRFQKGRERSMARIVVILSDELKQQIEVMTKAKGFYNCGETIMDLAGFNRPSKKKRALAHDSLPNGWDYLEGGGNNGT